MKNRIIRSLLVFVMMTVSVPMWTQDYLKIYFKDGRTERHFMHLVKSISATKYDLEGNLHTDYQMQQIVMQDTTYSYYLADIDSMAFRKVYEEQVSNRVQSVQSSLEPIFQKYSNLEDLVSHIDEIKSIDGIENVHYDGNDLFIQIRDWFDVCISRQPKPENIFSFGDLLSRKNVRQLVPTSKDGSQMKVTIGFQMENDIDFASSKQITEDLSHDFTIMDYETEYSLGEELDIDFFYRRIFDSNVLLIDTHGGCGLFNNKHYLYTGIKADHAWTTKLGLSVLRELGVDVNNVDLDDIGISSCSYNDGDFWDSEFGMRWYWTVKEDFIRKSPYRFKGSGPHVVFIAACSSLKGNDILTRSDNVHPYGSKSFAQVFFDKGADVYLGYNSGSRLSSGAAVTFYDYMMHGASVEQAFKHLLPGYKEENTPENALLVDLYNELSDNPQGIFIVNTHTMEKTEQEVLREYKETGQLKLKGETSICPSKHELYNSNYDFINYGFRLAKEPNVDTLKPGQYEEYMSDGLSRLATMTGLSEFSVEIIPYLGKTYYRAFTFDGIHYNWGEEKSYTITVLTLSEKLVSLEAGWTQSVTIYSGSGNYKVESDNEKVATVFVYDNLISINALSAGDATITVTDTKTGLTEIIEVTVTASLQLSATELTLIAGNNGTIEITLGSGEYGVTNLNSDIAKATLEGTTITINALAAGEAKVVVTDMQSGQQVVIDVTVNANSDIKSFSLAITELDMPVGEVRSISIRRGSGDFRVTNHNPDIAKGMIFESVYMPYYLEVEAFKPGTALIDVEDQKSGDVIQLTVTVTEGSGNPDNPHNSIISFVDPKVKEICVEKWDTNGDGELSYEEASAVNTLLRSPFKGTEITSFDELQYFTGLTEIWSSSFSGCSSLKTITIPKTVNSIDNGAFQGCISLASITIPNSVATIADYAFLGCESLISFSIPESVTSIGHDVLSYSGWYNNQPDGLLYLDNWLLGFKGNGPEGKLAIREGTKKIASEAFKGCSGLTSVITPNSMTTILSGAFKDCGNITSVTVGKSMMFMVGAFNKCDNLTSVTFHCEKIDSWFSGHAIKEIVLGDEVKIIGNKAFYGCSSLTSFTMTNSVLEIGPYAFSFCRSLTSITIPNSVRNIGEEAFSGCSSLTSIIIPNSVTEIGTCAFADCSSLTSVYIPNAEIAIGYNAFWNCDNLTTVTFHCKEIKDWFAGKKSLKEVIMGDEVIIIGSDAFSGCIGLNTVNIPNSVTTIGSGAFAGCSNLTSVTISNSVVTIDNCAFQGCVGLTAITIPNSVTSIGGLAFHGCSGLTSVTIGKSVKNIGYDAFYDCNNLKTITFHCNEIGNGFEGMESIKEIFIGDEVTSIGRYAFKECTGLTNITIGKSLAVIGPYAFKGCNNFTSLTLPNSLVVIEDGAFEGCSGLTAITIPNSVTSIGNQAFLGCSGLLSLTINSSTIEIGNGAFSDCDALKTVILNCKEVGSWFEAMNSINEVVIGDEVTSIGHAVFRECNGLTNVTIGCSVKSIENYAFGGCSSLQKMVSFIKEPFELQWDVFYGLPKDAILYVPAGTKAKYEATEGWNRFKNIVEMGGDDDPVSQQEIDKLNAELDNLIPQISEAWSKLYNKTFGEEERFAADIYGKLSEFSTRMQQCRTMLSEVSTQKEMESLKAEVASIAELLSTAAQQTEAFSLSFGDTFVAASAEGIELKFTVLSAQEKTCLVGDMSQQHSHSALTNFDQTGSVTVPATVNYNGETYKVTEIGPGAFSSCRLSFINIPSVSHIWMNAFWFSQITEITIPESVTGMGPQIFSRCSQLKKVICLIKEPIVLNHRSLFDGIPDDATLYVPAGTKALYEATEGWKNFKNIVEME